MTKSIKNLAFLLCVSIGAGTCVHRDARSQDAPVHDDGVFSSASEARAAQADGALLLDARPLPSFLLAHAEGAVRIAWDDFSDPLQRGLLSSDRAALATRLGALGVANERPVYVIGAWEQAWGEEGRIAWMLRTLGHRDVRIVDGGLGAWVAAGNPIARGPQSAEERTFTPDYHGEIDATRAEVAEHAFILDVRTPAEFEGATLYGEARGGHIPGATNIEWTRFLNADGTLRSAAEIQALVGAPLDASIVTYCTGGVRSAFVWSILERSGYHNAANYPGSWWEWSALTPAP